MLLNQELVMVKDTCEITITKMLAWLVEPLVVSEITPRGEWIGVMLINAQIKNEMM